MTIKVYISPMANDGILRVIEAQLEHLPKFDIELAVHPGRADIIVNHGTDLIEVPGVPSVHIGHGLYWSRQKWGDDFMDVNRMVVESMRHAVAHTAPSEWVSRAIRRGGFWYPEVVYHGIDASKFVPSTDTGDYVLWNKARADYVSDPNDVMKASTFLPKRNFISTIGLPSANLKIVNPMPFQEMKKLVSRAGVYLATARETFGIGTLEALAYGIPVAGWDWGGQSEIILQGKTGYLAPPGDYKALAECIERCFSERSALSANAVEDARTRWRWEPRIEQYANIFKRVYAKYYENAGPKVSVIVTAYKLDEYLPQCLNSIHEQTMSDFECLVVDDANLESTRKLVGEYARRDNRFRYVPTQENRGLPGARNLGLQHSYGKYIRHVDADDYLAPNALELEAGALDLRWGVDIVYGHLAGVRPDGSPVLGPDGDIVREGWPEEQFKWNYQMAHLNQLPSCVMARREVFERSGGYRERMTRQEDAEFWCRVTSLGFRAEKITQAITYFHRQRDDSKGAVEWASEGSEPDWTAWFPWRMGASDYTSAKRIIDTRGDRPKNTYLVPFGAQGKPPNGLRFWYVHDHAYPVVSIIVTCGPGHKKYIIDALDSIQAQNYPDWECVVVNDSGEEWPKDLMGAPWAKVVNMGGNRGASVARNEGYKHIHRGSKYVIWMDADDYWLPWFLERMVSYAENNFGVIFSDLFKNEEKGKFEIYKYPEFQSEAVATSMRYPGSSILYPREIVEDVFRQQGGYDDRIPGMEDWDFQIMVHVLGYCAYHIPEPLFIYRIYSSTKRDNDYGKIDAILRYLDGKYPAYRTGEKQIMCGCASAKLPPVTNPSSLLAASGNFTSESIALVIDPTTKNQMVAMEYMGPNKQTFSIRSRVDKNLTYRFGNNPQHRIKYVLLDDAQYLLTQNYQGEPIYRVLTQVSSQPEVNDPASFLGQPITA